MRRQCSVRLPHVPLWIIYVDVWSNLEGKKRKKGRWKLFRKPGGRHTSPFSPPGVPRPQSLFWKEYNCNHMNQQSSLSWICITVYLCVTVYASAVSKRLHLFCQCKISLNSFLLFPSWPHGALSLFEILQMTSLCNTNVIMGCYRSLHIF